MSGRERGTVVALLLLLYGRPSVAGPWVRESGSSYAKLGVTRFVAPNAYVRGTNAQASFESTTAALFAEVGLPWSTQAVVNLPFIVATQGAPGDVRVPSIGFGDSRVELDRAVLTGAVPLAVGVEAKLPLYSTIGSRAQHGAVIVNGRLVDATTIPDVGDGNVDVAAKAIAGKGLSLLGGGWLQAELGYVFRTGSFSDGVAASFTAGLFPTRFPVAVQAYLSGVKNVEAPENVWPTREYLYAQALVLWKLPFATGASVTGGVGDVLLAHNCSKGFDVSVGFAWER